MGTWQSAFLHEFLDGNPANYRAVPGELSVMPNGLVVQPTPEADQRGFPIKPGHRLTYALTRRFDEVIGIDIALDLFFPPAAAGQQLLGRVILGDSISLLMGFIGEIVRLQLVIGPDVMAKSLPVPGAGRVSLRARWHTHGQAHFWINGELVAYEPGLSARASFSIDQLTLGHHSAVIVTDFQGFLARRICVKVLRRNDANRTLDQLLPIDAEIPLSEECKRQIAGINRRALSIVRQFMAESIGKLTTSWQVGQPHAPFSPQSVAAHAAAVEAGRNLSEFLLHQRSANAEQFVQRIGEFMAVLAASDPVGYANVIQNLTQLSDSLEPACRAALEPLARQHATTLEPVAAMLEAMWTKVQSPGVPDA